MRKVTHHNLGLDSLERVMKACKMRSLRHCRVLATIVSWPGPLLKHDTDHGAAKITGIVRDDSDQGLLQPE